LFHPTNRGWESKWFLSLVPTVASIYRLTVSAQLCCRMCPHRHNEIYPYLFLMSTHDNDSEKEGDKRNLIFKCKMKGREKDIQFQRLAGCGIDQISFLPCIHKHLLSLFRNTMWVGAEGNEMRQGCYLFLQEIIQPPNVPIVSVGHIDPWK